MGGIYEVDKTSGGSINPHRPLRRTPPPSGGGRRGSDKLFTGQREMAGLGIYHYGARFHSTKLGRFLSADTIVPGYANPQNLNRYSYVRGNPIKYIDPSGHGVDCGIGMGDCVSDYTPPSGGNGGGGNNNDDDEEEEPEVSQQLQYCLEHPFAPQCTIPPEETLAPIQPNYVVIWPWEFDHLDAWGFQLNGTGCLIIICGDVSLSLIGNPATSEATLFLTPGIHFGLGYGIDGSAGIVGAYDTPSNSSLAEGSQNFSLNITPGTGGQGTYGVSESPNVTGNYAQTYSLSVSGGGEASAVYGPSYSFPIGTCTRIDCYWGVR
jgi:RHS repeat-associated protein